MPPSSRDRTSHSLSTHCHATPLILHLNTLQLPNTSSDISQAPLHSVFAIAARATQISRHTQIRTGPHHSQTAAQLAHSCSSCAEALSPGPHNANALFRSHRPRPNTCALPSRSTGCLVPKHH